MEFITWPKTPRLFRDVIVSEKIDGTNACIIFEECEEPCSNDGWHFSEGEDLYVVGAQSRNRLIYPASFSGSKDSDNAGFAAWVYDNATQLFELLGPGRHYGEWWGQGVARKYDMDHKVFSVFNSDRWFKNHGNEGKSQSGKNIQVGDAVINSVPVLYHGPFSERAVQECMYDLQTLGSVASPGFMKPEGIVVFHAMAKQVFKVTLDNEDKGKWEARS